MIKTRIVFSQDGTSTTEQYDDGISAADCLAAYRYKRENEGVTINGVAIPTDIATRINLKGYEGDLEDVDWKTKNGFVTLTPEQVTAIGVAVRAHVKKCFSAEATVLPNIGNYTTEQQIKDAFDAAYAA